METKQIRFNAALAVCLIVTGASMRLAPHPANLAPVAAVSLFGGTVLPRKLALWVPALAMIASDAVIGFYDYRIMLVVWSCYVLTALASSTWLTKPTVPRGAAMTLGGSVLFFIATNFAVWLWGAMYVHSWNGLMQCYSMALPFFRNTIASDLLYSAALFGLYAFVTRATTERLSEVTHIASE